MPTTTPGAILPTMDPVTPLDEAAASRWVDQRVCLHGVGWDQYEALLAMRGESSALRVTYRQGELEIMAPSWNHEHLKKLLARLIQAYAEEEGIELNGAGSWTLKNALEKVGLEPDECYIIGPKTTERPDMAIEVVWTSGGVSKLDIYRTLGVPEVWFYERGALRFHTLGPDGYTEVSRSALLPHLDPALLLRFMSEPQQTSAVRAYRRAVRTAAP
jgi:Uma2 family endonuclease